MDLIGAFNQFAEYNKWINERLLSAADRLTPEERRSDRGAFFGSVDGTFNHLLIGDSLWLDRFAHASGSAASVIVEQRDSLCLGLPLDGIAESEAGAISARRRRIDALIVDWVDQLDQAQCSEVLSYTNTKGRPFKRELGATTLHFFNHQTHHRGQLSTLLFQCGIDIGVTDMIELIPETA